MFQVVLPKSLLKTKKRLNPVFTTPSIILWMELIIPHFVQYESNAWLDQSSEMGIFTPKFRQEMVQQLFVKSKPFGD